MKLKRKMIKKRNNLMKMILVVLISEVQIKIKKKNKKKIIEKMIRII